MNPTVDSTTLVTAMLWLLALALPLAMLLWMAAQYVAIRAMDRRVCALEAALRHPPTTSPAPSSALSSGPTAATIADPTGAADDRSRAAPDDADDEVRAAEAASEGHA